MDFPIAIAREIDDVDRDDRMFPVPLSPENRVPFQTSVNDGEVDLLPDAYAMKATTRKDGRERLVFELSQKRIQVFLTDSRLVVYCYKYDDGKRASGFGLGLPIAGAVNLVSRAVVAQRTKNLALVGQVQFPWLHSIGAQRKTGWLSSDRLILSMVSGSGRDGLFLELTFAKNTATDLLVQQVVNRAAHHRMARFGSYSPQDREEVVRLTSVGPPPVMKDKWASYTLPASLTVNESTARYSSDY